MLDRLYFVGHMFMSRGWIPALVLIALTIGLGTNGFLATKRESDVTLTTTSGANGSLVTKREPGVQLTLSDSIYNAAGLLAIQTGNVETAGNWQLECARWLGMLFFSSALLTFVISKSRESVHRALVKLFANGHTIIAGLGQHGVQLVGALRKEGTTVVVIESDRNHPAIEQCRQLGVVVLFDEPDSDRALLAANLKRASTILALFLEERQCVRVVTTAYRLLAGVQATSGSPPVRCVLRLTEPGLLDVVRQHQIKTSPCDRIQLEILNSHEITATTMVRDAVAYSPTGTLRKVMVLGLGTHHRLGEMVILRAAKDHFIAFGAQGHEKLEVHVYDSQAAEWFKSFTSRFPSVNQICTVITHNCWARKVGGSEIDSDYDAAFVCISDEGHATAQAVMLRRDVLKRHQPIMVRVLNSHFGFGELISHQEGGWGDNIHAVGLEDSLYDPAMATQPEMEVRAKTIHSAYRALSKDSKEPANQPWLRLDETFREANRKLADRYESHLEFTDDLKKKRYRCVFSPEIFSQATLPANQIFCFSDEELDSLAKREHDLWRQERELAGWKHGETKDAHKKTNPLLVEYHELLPAACEYNREFVRSISRILAMADYLIVPIQDDVPAETQPAPAPEQKRD